MSDRVSQTIILCEDKAHCRSVKAYMKVSGLNTEEPRCIAIIASEKVQGGNVKWVLSEFPRQLAAARARQKAFANTLLIVVVDADNQTVTDRCSELSQASHYTVEDPLVLLIPRRNIETWMQFAAGPNSTFNEIDDYKPRRALDKSQVRAAARQIHGWAHDNPRLALTNVPSLTNSLDHWRKIG